MTNRSRLTRYAWLSIAAALITIALKVTAWRITNSVGLLSDAAESLVNLVAAVVALIALSVAAKRPDRNHHYGHSKAEYLSAVVEGAMIFVAAGVIVVAAINRLLHPQDLAQVDIGLTISVVASVINGAVAVVLMRAGRRHRSITLSADGKHLMTDVWTSVGVVAAVFLVWLTGWTVLDPIIALAVGINIMVVGWKLVSESTAGLMDASLPAEENARIRQILASYTRPGEIDVHGVRTRESGSARFMEFHLLVPGSWTVERGHAVSHRIEDDLVAEFPEMHVVVHLEPIDNPTSYEEPGPMDDLMAEATDAE